MYLPPYRVGLQKKNPSPYYDPTLNREQSFQDFFEGNRLALGQDFQPTDQKQYDWLSRAGDFQTLASQLNMESASNAIFNQIIKSQQQQMSFGGGKPGGGGGGLGGNTNLAAVLRALGAKESGNSYSAVNPDSGAMGRWQVMPSNIAGSGGWDMEALGRNVSTSEFLNSPKIQNAIVRHKFGNYMNQYGLKGALSAWYSGDPGKWNDRDPQGNYPSVYNYVMDILRRLGLR